MRTAPLPVVSSLLALTLFAAGCSSTVGPAGPSTAAAPWVGTYDCTETLTTTFAAQAVTTTSSFQDEIQLTASGNALSGEVLANIEGDAAAPPNYFPACTILATAVGDGATASVAPTIDAGPDDTHDCFASIEAASGASCGALAITGGSFAESQAGGLTGTLQYTCSSSLPGSPPSAGDDYMGTGTMTVTCTKE